MNAIACTVNRNMSESVGFVATYIMAVISGQSLKIGLLTSSVSANVSCLS